ncbi:uncharacterized protein LOC117337262 [Pecten maximus]|uniref:uncharacterized protein LOC117337262 n=1 Tax=Pecten maximus TaxID=6579 RepID=UPI00145837A9|nr:uncharacterized protein LOC117337262 [Pecten maximus]
MWRKERDNVREILAMTGENLNFYLGRFIVEARKRDGTEFPSKSLYLITCGLLRYLRDNDVNDKNILDANDHRFAEFRKILDSRMKDLLKRGIGGKTKQAEPILPEDEAIIWEKGIFGDKTADTLQCTMFFYNCKLFGMRGHDEHHALECDQFIIGEDSKGKYVEFVGRASKTFKGGLAQREIDIKNIRHYSNQGERCIVDLYEKYLQALVSGKFYRRALPGTPPRFGNQPVGVNKLRNLMKIICARAGLSGNYTNHSGKRTCATQLYIAGVDEQEIMNRTGHRSEKAVRKYKSADESVLRKVSSVLDPPQKRKCPENKTHQEEPTAKRATVPLSDISNLPTGSLFNNCQVTFNVGH